jgi:hypothetical protein
VKIAPEWSKDPLTLEPVTFAVTVDRTVDVRGFKQQLAVKLATSSAFRLTCGEAMLRDEEVLEEALLSRKGKNKWPKPYTGKSARL